MIGSFQILIDYTSAPIVDAATDAFDRGEINVTMARQLQEEPALAISISSLAYLGAAFWAMWVMLMYGGGLLSLTVESASVLARSYMLSTISLALTELLFGVAGTWAWSFLRSRAAIGLAAVIAAGGTAAAIVGGATTSAILLYVGNALTGLGTGCIVLRCAMQYAAAPPRSSNLTTALMMAFALLASALFESLSRELLAIVMVALPILAALFSFFGPCGDAEKMSTTSRFDLVKGAVGVSGMLLLLLLVFMMSGIVPFALSYEVFSIRSSTCILLALSFCAVVVVMTALLSDKFPFAGFYAAILGIVLMFYLGMLAVGEHVPQFAIFFSVASIILNMVAWSFLASVSYHAGSFGLSVFAFGRAFIAFGTAIGWFAGSYRLIAGDGQFFSTIVVEVLVAVAGLVVIVVKGRSPESPLPFLADVDDLVARNRAQILAQESDQGHETSADNLNSGQLSYEMGISSVEMDPDVRVKLPSRWRIRMMLLAEKYGLTSRETEVFMLLSKGRDAQTIANDLTVSLSTVRTHIRGIYAKMGVHSRRDFLQLLEADGRAVASDSEGCSESV